MAIPYPAALKQTVLEDAKHLIMAGQTLEQIATKHGIHYKTLQAWLLAMGDEYKDLRRAWIDSMLIDSREALTEARTPDALSLARAREGWKADTWLASKMDSRYADKQDNTTINIGAGSYLDALKAIQPTLRTVSADIVDADPTR